jgi:hypothetical protein
LTRTFRLPLVRTRKRSFFSSHFSNAVAASATVFASVTARARPCSFQYSAARSNSAGSLTLPKAASAICSCSADSQVDRSFSPLFNASVSSALFSARAKARA